MLGSRRGSTRASRQSSIGCGKLSLTTCLESTPRARQWQIWWLVAPSSLPSDIITQFFLGADIPPIPAESLLKIEGITHTPAGNAIRSNILYPGSTLVVRVPGDTLVHNQAVPFLVAVAVETACRVARAQQMAVVWYLPTLAPAETFRQGHKKEEEGFYTCLVHGHPLMT